MVNTKLNLKILVSTLFISLSVLLLLPTSLIKGYSLTSVNDIAFDTTIISDKRNYSNPSEVLIVPIDIDNLLSSKENVKGIIYYTIDRLGLGNTLFHYFLDSEGNVFEGNTYGEESSLSINNSSSSVVVGYLNTSSSSSFDPRSIASLTELLIDVCNRNSIKPENISVKDLSFKRSIDNNTLEINSSNALGGWETSIKGVKSSVGSKYSPVQKEYSAEVLEVSVPSEEVLPGEEVIVSVKLKNTSKYGNYKGYDSEIFLTKIGGNSAFYINNVWESQSQTSIMDDGINFLPNDEVVFDFKVRAPLFVGNYAEDFEFKTLTGSKLNTDRINIQLNIGRSDKQIVEIKNNANGFANVYRNPVSSGEVLIRAASGERYFLKSENLDTLWAEIDIGDGTSGWLAIWNITYL